ncbi:MAG: hypothetical protein K1X92_09805 [Bacteroidia bacterium]|nr:hypothetical protein [Bacteroidia bacterium]
MKTKQTLFYLAFLAFLPAGLLLTTSCGPGTTIDPVDIEVTGSITTATTPLPTETAG